MRKGQIVNVMIEDEPFLARFIETSENGRSAKVRLKGDEHARWVPVDAVFPIRVEFSRGDRVLTGGAFAYGLPAVMHEKGTVVGASVGDRGVLYAVACDESRDVVHRPSDRIRELPAEEAQREIELVYYEELKKKEG